jgi:4'-phosphopantetheinyl transferase
LKSRLRKGAGTSLPRLARTLALSLETHRLLQRVESPAQGVDIWQAHLDSASVSEIGDLRQLLSAAERERAEKFYLERDRARFIVAHGLLRHLLSRALERSSAIEFAYGENGKPALADDAGLEFNLSHSADWAVFALAWKRRIGIDLESAAAVMRSPRDLPGMAERIFSAGKFTVWFALDQQERTAAFLRAWTRKEACLKAAGLRLDDMALIEVGFATTNEPQIVFFRVSPGDAPRQWRIYDVSLHIAPRPATEATACALAIEEQGV